MAVSREETRPVLTGVFMQFKGDKVVMTSTDRFRLSRATFTWSPENPDVSTNTLLRGSLLRDIAKTLNESQNVTINFSQDNPSLIGFENAGRVSTSQLIDGEFPAIDRLFADEYPIQAVIDKQQLINSIKRVVGGGAQRTDPDGVLRQRVDAERRCRRRKSGERCARCRF